MPIKRTISLLTIFAMLLAGSFPAFAADGGKPFGLKGHWAETAVQNAIKNGLLDGDSGISPDAPVTRFDFADMVTRAYGAYTKADLSGYSDIAAGSPEAEVMAKAVQMKAFKGEGGKLYPDRLITREEACLVLARLLYMGAPDSFSLSRFGDGDKVSPWARPAVSAMVYLGYINGDTGMLRPKDPMTRSEAAQLLDNIFKVYISEPGVYTSLPDGNVMIRVSGVTLKDVTVRGMVVVGDGVGEGNCNLRDAKIDSITMVRGGGPHTTVAGQAGDGEQNTVVLLQDPDGTLGQILVTTAGGSIVINQPNFLTTVSSFTQPPAPPVYTPPQSIQSDFGDAIGTYPNPPRPSTQPPPPPTPGQQEGPPPEPPSQPGQEQQGPQAPVLPAAPEPPGPSTQPPPPPTSGQQVGPQTPVLPGPPEPPAPGQQGLQQPAVPQPPDVYAISGGNVQGVFGTINAITPPAQSPQQGPRQDFAPPPVVTVYGQAQVVNILTPGTQLIVAPGASIISLSVAPTAPNFELTVQSGGSVQQIMAYAPCTITGTGSVGSVTANAGGVAVNTPGTTVTAAPGTTNVTAGGFPVAPGTSASTTPPPPPASPRRSSDDHDSNGPPAFSSNANLTALSINGVPVPDFSGDVTEYETAMSYGVESVTVTAQASETAATVMVNGAAVPNGTASGLIGVNTGNNDIAVSVLAPDGTTSKMYHITLVRLPGPTGAAARRLDTGTEVAISINRGLSGAEADSEAFALSLPATQEEFHPSWAEIDGQTVRLYFPQVILSPNDSATVSYMPPGVNGLTTADGFPVSAFDNLPIVILSSNANLTALWVNGVSVPGFSGDITDYTVTAPSDAESVTVTAQPAETEATLAVNETSAPGGTASVSLVAGENGISICVLAPDGVTSKTYVITAIRAPAPISAQAELSDNDTVVAISMDGDLDDEAGVDPAAFTLFPAVAQEGIHPVTADIDGQTVYLCFQIPISFLNESASITYTPTGTNDLTNGSPVSDFDIPVSLATP